MKKLTVNHIKRYLSLLSIVATKYSFTLKAPIFLRKKNQHSTKCFNDAVNDYSLLKLVLKAIFNQNFNNIFSKYNIK